MGAGSARIVSDPAVMMDKPCVWRTRVTVEAIFDGLRDWNRAELGEEYGVTPEDIAAALEYACAAVNREWRASAERHAAAKSS